MLSIETNVEIGFSDNLDKGLGYEKVYLTNSSHPYANLPKEQKEILSNLRITLIEFTIRLAEKLINENSSDTILLILISRVNIL